MSIFSRFLSVFGKKLFEHESSLPPSKILYLPTTETDLPMGDEVVDLPTELPTGNDRLGESSHVQYPEQLEQAGHSDVHKLQVFKQGASYYALDSAQLKHYKELEAKRLCDEVRLVIVPLKHVPKRILQLVRSSSQNDLTSSATCYFQNMHLKFKSQVDITSSSGNIRCSRVAKSISVVYVCHVEYSHLKKYACHVEIYTFSQRVSTRVFCTCGKCFMVSWLVAYIIIT